MAELKVGDKAPQFNLFGQDGKKYSLKDFRGKKVVLYFYPEDDTETCTAQACSFRDNMSLLKDAGSVTIGVSPDDTKSHQKFSAKYDLNFTLISDEDKKVMKQYGVWKKKQMFGHKFMGVIRTTFVIDGNGAITHIFPKVRIKGHVEKVLKALTEI